MMDGDTRLSTQDDLDDALAVLWEIVLTAVWDGKPRHLHRNMIIPEALVEHARDILKANKYRRYAED